jgi:holliday junction DNA helicase RuvA
MIARIRGTIAEKLTDSLIVEVGGLGYEVFVTAEDWGAAHLGAEAEFHVYEHLREDMHSLYGFSDPGARQLFTQLLGVSGVGPKVALGILSAARLDRLQTAIGAGDAALLGGVSGVGKKTAARIVVELRGKLSPVVVESVVSQDSTYQALIGLGYSAAQAAEAVAQVPTEITSEQARIKAALKELSK